MTLMKAFCIILSLLMGNCWSVKDVRQDPGGGYWQIKQHAWGWDRLYFCSAAPEECIQAD